MQFAQTEGIKTTTGMVAYSVENTVLLKSSNNKTMFYKNSIIDLQVANDNCAEQTPPTGQM